MCMSNNVTLYTLGIYIKKVSVVYACARQDAKGNAVTLLGIGNTHVFQIISST